MKTVVALVAAGVVFCAVVVREWHYRVDHPYALGPSGELIALAVGGAVVAFALAAYIHRRDEDRQIEGRFLRERIAGLHNEIGGLQDEIRGLTIDELEVRQLERQAREDAEVDEILREYDS